MGRLSSLITLALAFALAAGSVRVAAGQAVDPAKALADTQQTPLSKGPHGENPVPASAVTLSSDEMAKVQGLKARAAIVMHYAGNDWARAQVAGLKAQFAKMGIEVIAVTDAGFKPEKQVSDIETILAQKPQIIVSIPTDPISTALAYRRANERGVKLVFMDNVPQGLEPGKEYISVVSADNYGNGVVAAHLMAKILHAKGQIGLIYHAADFFVTRQRYDGFKQTIAEHYPDMKIVAERGIGGPDFTGDADRAASAILTSNRHLTGMWVVWDVPAEGAISAARSWGREDLVITTCDLGLNVAIDMAQNGLMKGLGAQRPYDQGATEALLAGYGLLGKPAPVYVALPALPVTRENLLEAWKEVYHTEIPSSITRSMQ